MAVTLAVALCLGAAEPAPLSPAETEARLAQAFAESPDDRAVMRAYAGITRDPLLRKALLNRFERSVVYRAALETVYDESGRELGAAVRVSIDGCSLRLLVDTGAEGVTLASGRFGGGGQGVAITVAGFGAETPARRIAVSSLRVGDLDLGAAAVVETEVVLPRGIDGVIGTDVFSAWRVRLDYVRRELTLSRQGRNAAGWSKVVQRGHLMYVESREGPLLLDTGAAMSVVSRRASAGPPTRLQGVSGNSVQAERVGLACVTVAAKVLCDPGAVTMDLGQLRPEGTAVAGLIGYGALKRLAVEIDYPGGRVRFGD